MNNNEENPYINKNPHDILQGWHEKAREQKQDPYASFVLEYLSFIFYLKKIKKLPGDDAIAIIRLKKDKKLREEYLKLIKEEKELQNTWQELIKKLDEKPLKKHIYGNEVLKIKSIEDWENMLDFWRIIRNHLFHAEKDSSEERDVMLVSYAYKTLSPLIGEILLKKY
jgi:hypothetical protein